MREVQVLNVAEKPSVARSLASVFARMPGARDMGMRREAHQVFTAQNVQFPALHTQGHGQHSNGPGES
jgi:DNA topoisomerase-3